jgi:hypothetical protein
MADGANRLSKAFFHYDSARNQSNKKFSFSMVGGDAIANRIL